MATPDRWLKLVGPQHGRDLFDAGRQKPGAVYRNSQVKSGAYTRLGR